MTEEYAKAGRMLRPSRHAHPDRTVVNAAVLLLARLKSRRLKATIVFSTMLGLPSPEATCCSFPL